MPQPAAEIYVITRALKDPSLIDFKIFLFAPTVHYGHIGTFDGPCTAPDGTPLKTNPAWVRRTGSFILDVITTQMSAGYCRTPNLPRSLAASDFKKIVQRLDQIAPGGALDLNDPTGVKWTPGILPVSADIETNDPSPIPKPSIRGRPYDIWL